MTYKKKLIEVALPLEAINAASAREKSIRHGHPSTLHLWWARRPLAACRAVLFAQLVDDPSAHPDEFPTEDAQQTERLRLFKIIEDLVVWENSNNETVLNAARAEILKSTDGHPPPVYDPFCGGGSIPLEAQRLGLEAYASDLNPVAVLITKAMIEFPPKFAGLPPVNPDSRAKIGGKSSKGWSGANGLAEDVRYYGKWMRDEAEKRIGHLYPKIEITAEMALERPDLNSLVGKELTVIAWLWARTVKSPNPAYAQVDVPLASTFMLSTKPGKEAYVEPVIESGGYQFIVKTGKPKDVAAAKNGTKLARGANFRCLMSSTPISGDYIKAEGRAGRMGARLMAIVAEGERCRIYLAPTPEHEVIARQTQPTWKPDIKLSEDKRAFWTPPYGVTHFSDLFTSRQLLALTTFSDLVGEAREKVKTDALRSGISSDETPLERGGVGTQAYADTVAVYLGCGVDKASDFWSSLVTWMNDRGALQQTFGRQAIPMVWDYSEANPFCSSGGNFLLFIERGADVIAFSPAYEKGMVTQADAVSQRIGNCKMISTDPPYYDNIGYADLSDFFYVWLRHSLQTVFPNLFVTLAVPKSEELVAAPYRHGSKEKAEMFFLNGMTQAMHRLAEQAHSDFPVTIYYAFKQSDTESEAGTSSTGWETFLGALILAGFTLTATLPIRTEGPGRGNARGTNALASSIVLVCRPRPDDAPITTRKDFLSEMKRELFPALDTLKHANIAPVDFAQAAIGPGMAVFSRYAKVLDASGEPLRVRDALVMINQMLDEYLTAQEGEYDTDTRWALAWFEQYGYNTSDYGSAETLSNAKNVPVSRLVESGILESRAGKVRLLERSEYPDLKDWDPRKDTRINAWEVTQRLIYALETGEEEAARLLRLLGGYADTAKELAYRLYSLCERKKWAKEALAYNSIVIAWPEIARLAVTKGRGDQLGTGL